ncbi:MAG: response regulator [Bacteriovoracaceae bacterium]|nr:response regulator [Bacteriovoracaceae bacterium]
MIVRRPFSLAIIDDNESIRDVVELTVENSFSPETVIIDSYGSGAEALAAFKERPGDILLLDINMPGMYGDSLLQEYLEVKRNAIVIIMSGDSSFTITSNCFLDGARFYLQKPFHADELVKILENCFYQLNHWYQIFSHQRKSGKSN